LPAAPLAVDFDAGTFRAFSGAAGAAFRGAAFFGAGFAALFAGAFAALRAGALAAPFFGGAFFASFAGAGFLAFFASMVTVEEGDPGGASSATVANSCPPRPGARLGQVPVHPNRGVGAVRAC
jgi:hypothetical protein